MIKKGKHHLAKFINRKEYKHDSQFELQQLCIVAYMLRKEGVVISREELLLNIGSIHYESSLKSIDVIIDRLFLIAQEHFKKQQQTAQLHRFLLAGQLLHTQSDANTSNLTSLKIKVANIQTQTLLLKGKTIMDLPFGKMVQLHTHIYFVHIRPPHPINLFDNPQPFFMHPFLISGDKNHFYNEVLEDIQPPQLHIF